MIKRTINEGVMMHLSPKIKEYLQELTEGLYKGYELQIEEVCKKLNLQYFVADFEDNISGAIIKDDRKDTYSVYVDRKHPRNRQRFTFAHEIGHYISYLNDSYSTEELKKEGGFEDRAISYRQDSIKSNAETEASLIAAELLMPRKKVDELIKQGLTPEGMAELFFVSPSAMTIRLKDLYKNLMVI